MHDVCIWYGVCWRVLWCIVVCGWECYFKRICLCGHPLLPWRVTTHPSLPWLVVAPDIMTLLPSSGKHTESGNLLSPPLSNCLSTYVCTHQVPLKIIDIIVLLCWYLYTQRIFPAYFDSRSFLFELSNVNLWWKEAPALEISIHPPPSRVSLSSWYSHILKYRWSQCSDDIMGGDDVMCFMLS